MIKVAQIGVGYWGPNLLRNLHLNKNCIVKTIVDLSEGRRAYVENLYPGIDVTDNINSVLNDLEINAVVIATPVNTHYNIAKKFLKSFAL